MTTLYVTYSGDATTRFDRDYYVAHHMPLVTECWGPLGLQGCIPFWPADANAGTIAIVTLLFPDEASLRAALASPETPRVLADVARFTDAAPALSLDRPL